MNVEDVVSQIIFLPRKFGTRGDISIYSLLKETGYFEMPDQITEANIGEALKQHSECINDWLIWSENKRSSSGWYFIEDNVGKYVVEYFPARKDAKKMENSDIRIACSAFIKREIEDIRLSCVQYYHENPALFRILFFLKVPELDIFEH